MKITIIGLKFAPEQIGIARYTTDMALSLSARGHFGPLFMWLEERLLTRSYTVPSTSSQIRAKPARLKVRSSS